MPRPQKGEPELSPTQQPELSYSEIRSQLKSRERIFEVFEGVVDQIAELVKGALADHRHQCRICEQELMSRADAKTTTALLKALLPYTQKQLPQTLNVSHSGTVQVQNTVDVQVKFFRAVDQLPEPVQAQLAKRIIGNLGGVENLDALEAEVVS